MGILDLLWILLIASAVQPLLSQRLLERARSRQRHAIEDQRGSRVILLVHRQETIGLFGLPLMRFIDVQDSEEVIRAVMETEADMPIDLILHTPGGLSLASLQIARAIARHPALVTAFVPHYAMSGGTLIALAADRVVMGEHAVLGPVDPQIADVPAASVLRAVARKETKDIEDDTLILADQAEMALAQLRKALTALLEPRLREDLLDPAVEALSAGQWTHDYPITPEEAAGLGLPVETGLPPEIQAIMRLYPSPRRRTSSVEYTQRPREAAGEGRSPER